MRRGGTTYAMRLKTRSGAQTPPQEPGTTSDPVAPAAPRTDRVGLPLPAGAAPAFACLSGFEAAEELLAQLAELVDQLARSPGGAAFQQDLMRRVKDGRVSLGRFVLVSGQPPRPALPGRGGALAGPAG